MQYQTLLSLTALLGAAAAFPAPAPVAEAADHALWPRQQPVVTCSHITGGLHLIAAGGANTDDEKDYGLLGSLARNITNAIPGSTAVSLPYNKQFIPGSSPPKLMPGAISGGMDTLKQYIVQYHHYCPNTKIALIGYSSGAIIEMNDLCYGGDGVHTDQINPLLANNIIVGTVVYGDETRAPNQAYNVGTCPQNYGGVAPRSNPGLCKPFTQNMQSYCDVADPDCCTGSGNDVSVHLSYPNKYDYQATQFIVNAFKKAGGA